MKSILTFIFISLWSLTTFAQYEIPEKALTDKVLNRILAVELVEETSDEDKHTNAALKSTFEEEWTLTTVEFFSPSDFETLLENKDDRYAYLAQHASKKVDRRSKSIYGNGRVYNPSVPGSGVATGRASYAAFTFSFYEFSLELIGPKKKNETVTKIGFANGELAKIDFLYLTQQLTNLLSASKDEMGSQVYYNVSNNMNQLTSSTLIIPKEYIKEKEVSKVGDYYTHPFELVDLDKYQDIILEKKDEMAYVKIIWSIQHELYLWVTVSAVDGKILSQTSFGGVKFGSHQDADDIIKVKHLGYAANQRAQEFNHKYK